MLKPLCPETAHSLRLGLQWWQFAKRDMPSTFPPTLLRKAITDVKVWPLTFHAGLELKFLRCVYVALGDKVVHDQFVHVLLPDLHVAQPLFPFFSTDDLL